MEYLSLDSLSPALSTQKVPVPTPPSPPPAPVKKKRKYTKRKKKEEPRKKKTPKKEPIEKEINHRNYIFREVYDKKMKYLKRKIMETRDPNKRKMYQDHIKKIQGKEIIN